MVTIPMLWVPIVLSAVLVFVASSLIWMVLQWHKNDYRPLPDEAALAEALRRQAVQPAQYVIPYAGSMAAHKDPEYLQRMEQGPAALIVVTPHGRSSMGKNLTQWFVYLLVVSVFVAYLASRTLPPGASYLDVFRVAGTTAVLAYSAALIPNGIWWGRPWSTVVKDVIDGVIYGLLTAGVFGWLWPR